jgi:membrane glycosyltransferase
MTPALAGLVLSVPLVAFTSSSRIGASLRHLGLLVTPEEITLPPVLARARQIRDLSDGEAGDGVLLLLRDKALRRCHRAMLPPPRRRGDPIDAVLLVGLAKLAEVDTLKAARAALTAAEIAATLGSEEGLNQWLLLDGNPYRSLPDEISI